jgi:hypothetical protein
MKTQGYWMNQLREFSAKEKENGLQDIKIDIAPENHDPEVCAKELFMLLTCDGVDITNEDL